MKKLAKIIVQGRKLILLIFALLMIYSVASINKVNIEYSVTEYLPIETDTKQGLDIMDNEFVTYGTTTILIRNISYSDALKLKNQIVEIEGVKDLPFNNTKDYYNESSALFTITFTGDDEDETSINAYNDVIEIISDYDVAIKSKLVDTYADDLQRDINKILIMVIVIIILVLIFTSKSFAEVFVFLLIFGVSALLNMGTNYWFGTISFISNSVCVILQLALAIDYAIILSHRFSEEKELGYNATEAMENALSKAIPEIFGSSLTTIAGLLALCCMSLKLGEDLGLVLAKSIVCSIFTVFFLMPGLMLTFTKAIDKTSHRNFVPNITFFGKSLLKLRYLIPTIFIALVAVCAVFSTKISYVYSQESIDTSNPTESMIASSQIKEIFGAKNQFVIIIPNDSYVTEAKVIKALKEENMITDITGISNVEITSNGYTYILNENINYKDFANLIGIDQKTSKNIVLAYCYFKEDTDKDGIKEMSVFEANPDIYMFSILDIADCAFKYDDFISAYLHDDEDILENYLDIKEQIQDAEDQLVGTNYTRVVCNINGEIESSETFALIDRLNNNIKSISSQIIFAGDSMAAYDLNSSFSTDNLKITILTIIFVYLILMFTTNSWGTPLLQVLTIQGAIFINFAIPVFSSTNLYFFVYLIVSSIQMGATIDYAIVITNRYQELSIKMDKKKALIQTLNQSFPTILTSGVILTMAGFLISIFVNDPLISTLGLALGRGAIISIACVMCVLPLLLYFCNGILVKTKIPDYKEIVLERVQELKKENSKNEKD